MDRTICQNPSYTILRNDRPQRGGGVCAILSNQLSHILIDSKFIKNINILVFDLEDLSINVKLRFLCLYIPPKSSKALSDINFICSLIGEYISVEYPVLLCGDFNLPNISWEDFTATTESDICFLNFIKSCKFTQLVNFPSRGTNILDLVFTNSQTTIMDLQILPPIGNSDHNAINFKCRFPINKPIPRTFLNFAKSDFKSMDIFLANYCWVDIFNPANSLNQWYEDFLQVINTAISLFVPIEITLPREKRLPPHIQKLAIYRNKLWLNSHHANVKAKFLSVTKELDKQTRKFYKNLEKKFLAKSPNAIYSYINKSLKPKNITISPILHENNVICQSEQKAALFLNYFFNIYSNAPFARDLQITDTDLKFSYNLMFISDFTVFELLRKLDGKTNTSPDKLPLIILKKCAVSLAKPVATIFRRSFMDGKVPSKWKQAIIIPLPKVNNANKLSNFRPISLTSSMAKIAENCVNTDLESFLRSKHAIPHFQHGFVNRKSVYTSLLESIDDWTLALDQKKNVDCIFFDIRKAFDTVSHNRLFTKLENIGVCDPMLSWIKDFLSNRTFSIKINDVISSTSSPINCGVPQGTVLAPLLFNLFIADVSEKFSDPNIILKFYADDLKVYIIYSNSKSDLNLKINSLQNFVNYFINWCYTNGLRVAAEKCKVLHLGPSNIRHDYSIDEIPITKVSNHVRDLGLLITPDLKWQFHIKTKVNFAYYRWLNLMKVFKSTNPTLLVKLYKVYVRPIVDFASIIYNSDIKRDIDAVEILQKRVTRNIFHRCFSNSFSQPPPYSTRLDVLKLESLQKRRLILDLTYFYKIHNGEVLINEQNIPRSSVNNKLRGHTRKYHYVHTRLNIRRHSFFIRTPKRFGKIPNHIVLTKNSAKLKNYITNNFSDIQD